MAGTNQPPVKQTAVQVVKYNFDVPADAIEVGKLDIPQPGEKEVLIRLILRPVNPADIFSIQGVYPGFRPSSLPAVPGLEGVGLVDRNGPGASKFEVGQRVVAVPWRAVEGLGTWQQYVVVPESSLLAVPQSLTDETAAQFFVNPVTAYGFLESFNAPQGEYILQSAAGSVLGRQLIQMAKHRGVRTINVVRREEQKQELKDLGADEVICSTTEDVVKRVMEITGGKGAFGAVDPVGGETTGKLLSSLRHGGALYIYGAMEAFTFTCSIPDVLFQNKIVAGFWLGVWLASLPPSRKQQVLEEVMKLLEGGVVTPFHGRTFELEHAKEAVAHTQEKARGGKAFLKG
ncbi:hypothetical protein WJX72_002434 [[Myrmecia] bisecta]|uniref:Enoyl reductase (ER) domain-containing protein n=1 Tax=[Myrmecia] bisecta TaxID=41462 RepID=A0AAW1PH35_9CHLO